MIHFQNNTEKSLEVILWLASKRPGLDFHAILKLLFLADVKHLNEYGRPIVGGVYNALIYGPVSQPTYDILKREPLALEALGTDGDLPFEVRGGYHVHPKRSPNLRKLSRSDVKALEDAWEEWSDLGFDERTTISHRHPAYKNAEDAGRQRMRYEDFLDPEKVTAEQVSDLSETARRIRV